MPTRLLILLLAGNCFSFDQTPASPSSGAVDVVTDSIACPGGAGLINMDSGTLSVDCANNAVGVGITNPASILHIDKGTGVWFGMTFPTSSTMTWVVVHPISATAAESKMSRGAEFTSTAGTSVEAVDAPNLAFISGMIHTAGTSGTLTPRVKSELSTGRGQIWIGSHGTLEEQ